MKEPSEWPVYRIIRFRQNGKRRTIKSGLTLAEAQAHCSREDTRGPGWFDGYDYIKGFKPRPSTHTDLMVTPESVDKYLGDD